MDLKTIFGAPKAFLLRNSGKTGRFVENQGAYIGHFNQMWNAFHRTHGDDAISKKTFKKPLTFVLQDDILIKLTRERAVHEITKDLEN